MGQLQLYQTLKFRQIDLFGRLVDQNRRQAENQLESWDSATLCDDAG